MTGLSASSVKQRVYYRINNPINDLILRYVCAQERVTEPWDAMDVACVACVASVFDKRAVNKISGVKRIVETPCFGVIFRLLGLVPGSNGMSGRAQAQLLSVISV